MCVYDLSECLMTPLCYDVMLLHSFVGIGGTAGIPVVVALNKIDTVMDKPSRDNRLLHLNLICILRV